MGNSGENSESQNADRSVDNKEDNKVSLGTGLQTIFNSSKKKKKTLYFSSIQFLHEAKLKGSDIQQRAFQGSMASRHGMVIASCF